MSRVPPRTPASTCPSLPIYDSVACMLICASPFPTAKCTPLSNHGHGTFPLVFSHIGQFSGRDPLMALRQSVVRLTRRQHVDWLQNVCRTTCNVHVQQLPP